MGFLIGGGVGVRLVLIIGVLTGWLGEPSSRWPVRRAWLHSHRRAIAEPVGAALVGTMAAAFLTHNGIFTGVCALGASLLPGAVRRGQAQKRRERSREQWPDVLDTVVSGLRSGLGVGEALAAAGQIRYGSHSHTGTRGQSGSRSHQGLTPAFADFAQELTATGNLNCALDQLKDALSDPLADKIVEAIRMAARLGGHDLARILASLASSVRAENRARGELLARQSWTVNGARIAALAPWLVLALLSTRPGTIEAYRSGMGTMVLLSGLLATVVAYVLMLRLGRLPEMARSLARPRKRTEQVNSSPASKRALAPGIPTDRDVATVVRGANSLPKPSPRRRDIFRFGGLLFGGRRRPGSESSPSPRSGPTARPLGGEPWAL